MKMAYELGCNVVINQIGKVPQRPDENEESESRDLLLATLTELGKESQRVGAFLAARTGTEDGETLSQLINDLPTGSIVVDFDPGNLIINGFSASESAKKLGSYVQHVHARDGVQDLGTRTRYRSSTWARVSGLSQFAGSVRRASLSGYLTVQRDNASDPILECAQAVEFLKNI